MTTQAVASGPAVWQGGTVRFRGILFDVDGTLVGLRPAPEILYREVCREVGLDCPKELLSRARRVA